MNNRDVVRLQAWWMGQLSALTKKVISEEEKRQERAKKAAEKYMGDYRTEVDISEAYAFGVISEKKRDRLMDLLEQANPEPDSLYDAKMDLLSELYQEAKRIMNENMEVKP